MQWLVHYYNSSNSLTNFFIFFLSYPVVAQDYVTEAENEYVIRGNSAVMKCKIPSFVSDFVSIDAWVSEDNVELSVQTASHDYGNLVPVFDYGNYGNYVMSQDGMGKGHRSGFSPDI